MPTEPSDLEERAGKTGATVREVKQLDAEHQPDIDCPLCKGKGRVPVQGYCLSEYGSETPYCTFAEGVNYQEGKLTAVVCGCRI